MFISEGSFICFLKIKNMQRMSLDWLLDTVNALVSTLVLKGSDSEIFQALGDIQSLSQLLNSVAIAQKQP